MPELSNNQRIIMLGEAMFGRWWKLELSKASGIHRFQLQRWAKGDPEPMDESVNTVLSAAKKKRDELDRVIKAVTLYPWIT